MGNIYQLTSDFSALQSMLERETEEDIQEAIRNTLFGVSGEAGDIVEQSIKLIKNIESDAAGAAIEIERLSARKKSLEKRVDGVKQAIQTFMEVASMSTVKTPLFTATLAKGRKSVKIVDESIIPDDYMDVKTVITPMKKLISEAIESGTEIPGAELVTGDKSLRIK